jgi:hypothetical protein
MKDIRYKIKALINPLSWFQVGKFNKQYDRWLNDQIDSNVRFTNITQHHAILSGQKIWIENHPYRSFALEKYDFASMETEALVPCRATVHKAMDWLNVCKNFS